MKTVFLVALVAVLAVSAVRADGETDFEPKPIGRCPPRDIPNKPPRFLPDANDCSVYYECSGGKMITRKCPEGECFSRMKKGCAPP
ncbi:UNVERIFIED_CONTAM: hypothetical protein PYX00_008167 [Menopon gallinae]|uniref:Chitin-binding type-2 domain-containing protein n=1 Tax=Menopon gallinae TaxID=328185 RepID=A0AAW2HM67_9NEOP